EVLIARHLIRGVDSNPAMDFAWTTVIENDVSALRCVVARTTASELSILFACEKRRRHGYGLEGGSRNVVSAKRATNQRPIALVRFEPNPSGLVFDFFQAIRRFTVKREHFAGL